MPSPAGSRQPVAISSASGADWPSGRPRLLGAAAGLDCVLSASILVGDHRLFVGTIIATETAAYADPLLWSERQYQALERPAPFAAHVRRTPIAIGHLVPNNLNGANGHPFGSDHATGA